MCAWKRQSGDVRLEILVRRLAVSAACQFAGVADAQVVGMLPSPFAQPRFACGGRIDVQQTGHQALDFLAGDHHVAFPPADQFARPVSDRGRRADDEPPA